MRGIFEGCIRCKRCQNKCPEKALAVLERGGIGEINVRSDFCLGTAYGMNCPERVCKFTELKVQFVL